MDEIMKVLIPQAPMVVVLMYAIKTLYMDAKLERAVMRAQIDALTRVIGLLVIATNRVADRLNIDPIKTDDLITETEKVAQAK